MARAASPAEDLMAEGVKQAVTSVLKPAGFRKTGLNYHRRLGQTVQVVNVQVSHGSSASDKRFYVNAGICFDDICKLAGVPPLDAPKDHECDARGVRSRLEDFVPGAPPHWDVTAGEDVVTLVNCLRSHMEALISCLDGIDCIASFYDHPWFHQIRSRRVRAQALYLMGRKEEAMHEVNAMAKEFADRVNANDPRWWIEQLHLTGLKGFASGGPS
jgi:hypothetical protein